MKQTVRKHPWPIQAALWLLRAGGWQRIVWKRPIAGRVPPPLWVRHRFDEWMNP